MITTKVRKVGNSAAVTLSTEALAILDVKEGDVVTLVRDEAGGLRILPGDKVAKALEVAEGIMDRNRELLAKLA